MFTKEFSGKRILVTGGTGSIGSVIVKELLKYNPKQIRVFSRDETKQFDLSNELPATAPVVFLVGDIRDKERLNLAMENIDVVFHAAALKHVHLCERNPFEAVKTNVQGTQNVIDCAFANNVDRVVSISTDKAVHPTSVMGSTKALAEKLVLSSFFYKGDKKTKFCCVRFGNVLGSRGSVIPLFIKQIKNGGSLTVTDHEMTRFFMSIPDAVQLVFKASQATLDREIFVLKMPSVKIADLAQVVVNVARRRGLKGKMEIKHVGKREGEKIHEHLITPEEAETAFETKDMFIIQPNFALSPARPKPNKYKGAKKNTAKSYYSKNQPTLSQKEIEALLTKSGVLDVL